MKSSRVWLALSLVYVVWGSTYLAIRIVVETLPPFLTAGLRFIFAGALLFAWLRLRGVPAPPWIHWRSAAIVGVALLCGGNGLVVWSEVTVASGLAALLVSVSPLWMALFGWMAPRGQRPSAATVAGLLLGFGGLALLVGPDALRGGAGLPAGVAALVLAPIFWAAGSVYSKHAPLPSSPFMATALEMIAGGVALLLISLAAGEPGRFDLAAGSLRSWLALSHLVIFGSLVGFTAYIWALHHAPLTLVGTYAYVNPVVAVILGALILNEPLTSRTLTAGAIIIASVALITWASGRAVVQAEKTPAE